MHGWIYTLQHLGKRQHKQSRTNGLYYLSWAGKVQNIPTRIVNCNSARESEHLPLIFRLWIHTILLLFYFAMISGHDLPADLVQLYASESGLIIIVISTRSYHYCSSLMIACLILSDPYQPAPVNPIVCLDWLIFSSPGIPHSKSTFLCQLSHVHPLL